MQLIGSFLFVASVMQFYYVANAADCNKMPDFKPMDCCKYPKPSEAEKEKIKTIVKDLFKDKTEDYTSECKAYEALFKELKVAKDDDIDEEEIIKLVDKMFEDLDWKPVLESAVNECHKKVNAKLSDVQKKMEAAPFNVKKDECNVKYGSFIVCIKAELFEKCPSSKWTENKECSAAKQWYTDCGNSIDSFKELHSKKP